MTKKLKEGHLNYRVFSICGDIYLRTISFVTFNGNAYSIRFLCHVCNCGTIAVIMMIFSTYTY